MFLYFDVVTAVCQLLINRYVMLCYVIPTSCLLSLAAVKTFDRIVSYANRRKWGL